MSIISRLRIPIIARITIGLVGLLVTVLMALTSLGLFPDDRAEIARSRRVFCESAAVGFILMAENAETHSIRTFLESLKQRNGDIQSLVVRRDDGSLAVVIGDHGPVRDDFATKTSTSSQIAVQLFADGKPWGTFEATFTPLASGGYLALFQRPGFKHGLVATLMCLVTFYVYLRTVLRRLDPSSAVPSRVREALDTLAEGLLILDKRERIVLANEAFANATGASVQKLLGTSIGKFTFVSKDVSRPNFSPWREVIRSGGRVTGRLLGINKEGLQKRTFSVSASPISDDQGKLRGVLVSFEDVTRLEQNKRELSNMVRRLRASSEAIKKQNCELERLASRDPLTGCLNRRSFFERFDAEWKSTQQNDHALSAVMVDIDFFKSINDNYGHSMGDEVLRQVAAALRGAARESDLVCRFGGEEFAILLPRTDADSASVIAERFRTALEELVFGEFTVTASLGVSSLSSGGRDPQELLEQADKCLYVAKRNGRNQVVCWEDALADPANGQSSISCAEEEENSESESATYHAASGLVSALAHRDPSAAAHSLRVADLCVRTAEGLMPPEACFTLEMAALLHDIGKIGVPDSILSKPGPPTDDEWKVVRQSDQIGLEITRTSFASPELTAIIEQHRTAAGDPDAGTLFSDDTPLGSRILAIADAYDSMITDQVSRTGLSMQEAFTELRRSAGSRFDPELVKRFIAVVSERHSIQQSASPEVSKEPALALGSQIERLARALDEQDFDALEELSQRLQSTARKCGAECIGDKVSELGDVLDGDRDSELIIQAANELLELCRSTQQQFLDSQWANEEVVGDVSVSVSPTAALRVPQPSDAEPVC